jgi:6,7-dimethyl-8-ribityllumazine synthase
MIDQKTGAGNLREFKAKLKGEGYRFAIIASRYNDFITGRLVNGALDALKENDVNDDDIELFWVPGALEVPAAVQRIVSKGVSTRHFDGIIAIGCVIRGDTDHYTHVSTEAVRGVCETALRHQVATGNAILTVENVEQATERSGEKSMNKGYEAALVALEMANLFRMMK